MTPDEILALMDTTAQFVSAMTGTKAQLVNQGWSDAGAEQIVIEMLRMAPRQTGDTPTNGR